MKKILCVCVVFVAFLSTVFSQSLNADGIVSDMVMPDGNVATIALYKKWGPANTDIQAVQPKDKKAMIGTTVTKAKTESEIGYFRKTYKETETEEIAALCDAMKSCGAMYGVAWLDFGSRVTRCVFTYKSGKLTYDRMDFFDESNGAYADFVAKENAKKERAEKIVGDLTTAILRPIADGAVNAINNSNSPNFKTTPIEQTFRGHDGIRFKGYCIWYDNGDMDMDYIIDSAGNYRKKDSLHSYPIVKETIVPQKVRDAVAKMFN